MKPVDADPGGIQAIRSAATALAALRPMPAPSTGSARLDAELAGAWRSFGRAVADLAEALAGQTGQTGRTGQTGVDELPVRTAPIRN